LPRVQDHCGGKSWALGCAFFSLFQPSASKIWRDPPTRNVEILALLGRTDIPNTALWGLVFPFVVERQDRFCRLPSVRRWSANSIRDLQSAKISRSLLAGCYFKHVKEYNLPGEKSRSLTRRILML
jgi:hypothetical protein